MPVQVRRLLVVFVMLVIVMLGLKYLLTPESWREYGAYRGNALIEIADHEAKYVEMETCVMCHDSIDALKNSGFHKTIQCETCHGVGYLHAEDYENVKMPIPKEDQFCMRCHAKNSARPQNIIKQVDAQEHSEGEKCINCHNPHQPWL